MDFPTFLREFEEILEVDVNSLSGEESLENLESWDSLSLLTFMAFADEKLGKALTATELNECKSVKDLAALAGISD